MKSDVVYVTYAYIRFILSEFGGRGGLHIFDLVE
jgi:hypothetical protein